MSNNFFKKQEIITKLFPYMGNKLVHINLINDLLDKSNKNIYVEPFLGSAQVLLNLRKNYNKYYLAEIDTNLLNIFNQVFYNIDKNEFTQYAKKIINEYNPSSYEGYYTFREYFNTILWKTNSKEECFALLILINCCVNSMYRFGNNGFNQGYGSRYISEYKCINFEMSLDKVKQIVNRIELSNNAFNILNFKDSIYLLDPPYQINEMANHNNWSINDLEKMFSILDFNSNDIIYFDIENEIGNKYFKNKIILNKIKNISPNRKEEKILNEVCYYQIKNS